LNFFYFRSRKVKLFRAKPEDFSLFVLYHQPATKKKRICWTLSED